MSSQLGFQPSPTPYPHSVPGVLLQHQQLPSWQASMVGYAFSQACPPGVPPFPPTATLPPWNQAGPPTACPEQPFAVHPPAHRSHPSLHGHNTAFQSLPVPSLPDCDRFRSVNGSISDHSRDTPQGTVSPIPDKDVRLDSSSDRRAFLPSSGIGGFQSSTNRPYDRDDYLRALLCSTASCPPDMRGSRPGFDAKSAGSIRRPFAPAESSQPGPSSAVSAPAGARNQPLCQPDTRIAAPSVPSVSPQQVKDVIGIKEFYTVRATLIRQQQTLADQILELNKLTRMQGILVSEVLHPEYENCRKYHEELRQQHRRSLNEQDALCNKLSEDLPLMLQLPSKLRGNVTSKVDIPERYRLPGEVIPGIIKPIPRYKSKDGGCAGFDVNPMIPQGKGAAEVEISQQHGVSDAAANPDCKDSRTAFTPSQQPSTPTAPCQTTKPGNSFDPHADWFARHFSNAKPTPATVDQHQVPTESMCTMTTTSPQQPKTAQWWKDHAKIFGDIVLPSQLDSSTHQRESSWTRCTQDMLHPPLKKRSKFQEGIPPTSDRQETSQSLPSMSKSTLSKKERSVRTLERVQGTPAKKPSLKRVKYSKASSKSTRDSARSEPGSGRSASSEGGFVCASQKSLKSSSRGGTATQSNTQESAAVHTLLSFTSSYKLV